MRLIGYGPGEILDRLSILSIKLSYHPEATHFADEAAALFQQLPAAVIDIPFSKIMALAIDLTTVNSRIWQLEDALRAYQGVQMDDLDRVEASEIALRIQRQNDTRNQIIQKANDAAGHLTGPEKIR